MALVRVVRIFGRRGRPVAPKSMPWHLLPFVLVCAFLAGDARKDPFRPLDVEAAVRAARAEHKCVVVAVATPGTAVAKKVDGLFLDGKVKEWVAARAVAIRLDPGADESVTARFRIHVEPTFVFLGDNGLELDRLTGLVDSRTFRIEAESILGGGDPIERVKRRLVGRETDVHLRIDLGGAYYDRGLLDEALREYLWCWDHGVEADPGFASVRRGFLLREIQRLGRIHTPASDALGERATKLFERVRDCVATDDELLDFVTIHRALQREDRTLEAWDAILAEAESCAGTRARLARHVVDPMIDARRYEEAAILIVDGKDRCSLLVSAFDAAVKAARVDRPGDAEKVIEDARRKLRGDLARVYETWLGASRYDEAEGIATFVIEREPRGVTYVALLRAALRAEAHGAARGLVSRAEADKRLSDAERADVAKLAKDVLKPK